MEKSPRADKRPYSTRRALKNRTDADLLLMRKASPQGDERIDYPSVSHSADTFPDKGRSNTSPTPTFL